MERRPMRAEEQTMPLTDDKLKQLIAVHEADECGGGCSNAAAMRELLAYREIVGHWPGGVGLAMQRAVLVRVSGSVADLQHGCDTPTACRWAHSNGHAPECDNCPRNPRSEDNWQALDGASAPPAAVPQTGGCQLCGRIPALRKVGEEMPAGSANRHNLTVYLCEACFRDLMGARGVDVADRFDAIPPPAAVDAP